VLGVFPIGNGKRIGRGPAGFAYCDSRIVCTNETKWKLNRERPNEYQALSTISHEPRVQRGRVVRSEVAKIADTQLFKFPGLIGVEDWTESSSPAI